MKKPTAFRTTKSNMLHAVSSVRDRRHSHCSSQLQSDSEVYRCSEVMAATYRSSCSHRNRLQVLLFRFWVDCKRPGSTKFLMQMLFIAKSMFRPVAFLFSACATLPLVTCCLKLWPSSGEFSKPLERGWLRERGSPETHGVDADTGFDSTEFMKWSDQMGILLKPAAGEAHPLWCADIRWSE